VLKKLLRYCAIWAGLLFCTQSVADDNLAHREYQLKTAYLFHFAELADWPTATKVTICLQGNSALRDYLPVLNGQHIDGQAVSVKINTPFALEECQIVFFSDLQALSNAVLEQAIKHHVLLVSDSEKFANHGGMIEFTLRDNKIKLIVNLKSVNSAGLKLSSKLLRMAEILE
jgi:hypothetical protein